MNRRPSTPTALRLLLSVLLLAGMVQAGPGARAALMPSGPGSAAAPARLTALSGPAADFTATPTSGLAPLIVAFTNTTTGTYTSCLWEFGDGKSTTKDNPSHRYQKPGVYTVTLTVTDDATGLSSSETKPGYIVACASLTADFSGEPTTGVAPLEVTFTNMSCGDHTSNLWDFGDGITSTLESPSHVYAGPGAYTVTLTIDGPSGSDTETKPSYVTVYAPVQAGFSASPVEGVPPLEVAFTNTSTGDYTTSLWDFGDGITSTLEGPTHTYQLPGVYTVTLTVDGPGGTDTATQPACITAYTPSQASFSADPAAGVAPLEVAFTNTSSGDYATSLWDFGDGITSTLEGPTHTYQVPGVYTVTLTVDGPGRADTAVSPDCITVYTPVQAGLSGAPRSGPLPLLVAFTNTSTGDYATSLWDFGDGITSTLEGPTHTYQVPGVYTVTLTVDGPGGTDSITEPGYVTPFAEVPDPGPYYSNIFLQNLGTANATVNLAFAHGQTGEVSPRYDLGAAIAPNSPRSIASTDLAPAETSPWAGSGEVYSTQPLAAVVHLFWNWPSGLNAAGSYGSHDPPATTAYLPWLPVENGCLTSIIVQNAEEAEAQVQLAFYDRAGREKRTHSAAIPPRAESTFSLAELWPDFSATAYQGTARITANRQIATLVTTHRQDAYSEVYAGLPSGDTVLWAPGVSREQPSPGVWNHSAVIVQNLGSTVAAVHVEFINLDGSLAHALDDAIPPLGAAEYNTYQQGSLDVSTWQALVAALGSSWQGTVRVGSTGGQPLAGVCVHARASAGTSDRLTCNAVPNASATTKALAFPAVYRKLGGTSDQWSTAIVHNTAATAGTVAVEFYSGGVKRGDTYTVSIPANGSVRLDLSSGQDLPQAALTALGTSFSGAMRVTPSTGVRVVGVNQVFWSTVGRAAAYAGFAVP